MRRIITIVIAALMLPVGASADVYVKLDSHTDGYYRGGTTTPAVDTSTEMWIADERLAYITDSFKLVVDTGKKSMLFLNRRDNTFVESTLPLDKAKLFNEQDLGTLQVFQRVGEVKPSGAKKKIDKWECTGYDFHDWIDYEGGRVSEREARSWVTEDVPFDLEKLKEKLATLSSIGNLSDEYAKQRLAVSGFEVASEETTYNEGVAVTTKSSVVEMVEKEAPPEAYTVPEGATKKDTLTLADLRG